MASESITHSTFGLIGYWLIAHWARGIIAKYRRVIPIHGHLYWNLKREVSRSNKEFKISIIFRRRSREDSLFQALFYLKALNRLQRRTEWICESKCQVNEVIVYIFLRNILTVLNPYPSATTVYARSAFCIRPAFYFQSAVSAFYPWSAAVCSRQSAVYVLHWPVLYVLTFRALQQSSTVALRGGVGGRGLSCCNSVMLVNTSDHP